MLILYATNYYILYVCSGIGIVLRGTFRRKKKKSLRIHRHVIQKGIVVHYDSRFGLECHRRHVQQSVVRQRQVFHVFQTGQIVRHGKQLVAVQQYFT